LASSEQEYDTEDDIDEIFAKYKESTEGQDLFLTYLCVTNLVVYDTWLCTWN